MTVPWTANTKLPGFAWLEAVVLFLARDFEKSYFVLNLMLGVLCIALLYRIAWLWTKSHAVAWWSSVLLACLPARIAYSMSAASDIAGLFFFLLFLFFITEFKERNSSKVIWYAALFSGAYSICIRPMNGIFIFLGLAAALYIYQRVGRLDRKEHLNSWLNISCVFLPILIFVPYLLSSDLKAGVYSQSFVVKNVLTSFSYLLDTRQNIAFATIAVFIVGLQEFFKKNDALTIGLAVWFIAGILLISLFSAGGISYPGHTYSDRYFLFVAVPFVLLAAKGVVVLTSQNRIGFWSVILIFVFVTNAVYASQDLLHKAQSIFFHKKTKLLKQLERVVPDEAYIIDKSAALVTTIIRKRSIQTDVFLSGIHPQNVVFLNGVHIDPYDPQDPNKAKLIRDVLEKRYLCQSIVDMPFIEKDLSVMPFLCEHK